MSNQAVSLDIIIVGAGLAGLSAAIACANAGHKVTVVEAAPQLAEIGAGLQVTPNASRILYGWGLQEEIEKAGCEPRSLAVHRYSDGKILAIEDNFNDQMRQKYGSPFIDVHRGDLHGMLLRKSIALGVKVCTGSKISEVDIENNIVRSENGSSWTGDLIVGADGLWSKCREALLGRKDAPLPTGDLAFRIVLETNKLEDPELRAMVENPACRFWAGPGAHVVAYSMRSGSMFNLVLLTPDNLPENVARQEASRDEMKELFKDWDPVLNRLLDHVDKVDKWKLMHREELQQWTNDKGTFTLIGDSCHPMLPYLAQGANSAVEDGAALGLVLENLSSKEELQERVQAWVQTRKQRGEAIARETFHQRRDFHMVDGPEQVQRDELFFSQLGKEVSVKFPSRWTCPKVQPWLYGYDVNVESRKALGGGPKMVAV